MKRRKTKKVKMVRILGETVRKGGKKYRILLAERQRFLERQRDPQSSYYKIPISELLKSNRRRTKRCWKGYSPVKGMRPYSKGSCRRIRRNQSPLEETPLEQLRRYRMMRLKKPRPGYEFNVQGYYAGRWEDVDAHDNRYGAIQSRKNYDENEPGYSHRVIARRIKANRRRGLRRNPETTKARPIPGMFYSIWFSGRGGQTAKLVVKGEILKKASISNLSRMFPYFEMNKLQKLHTAGPYSSFDEAFLNR